MRARLCRRHSNHITLAFATEPSCMLNLTVRASVRLLQSARWRRTQCACSSLPPVLQRGTCKRVCFCDGFAMHAKPECSIKQACGCSKVRGRGGRNVRARPCRRYFNQAPASEFAFATETPCMQNLNVRSSKLAAAPKCEAEADAMCVLVSAAGTPTKAPAGVFAFATEPPCTLDLTVRSSLRLLQSARRRRTQCACSSLLLAL